MTGYGVTSCFSHRFHILTVTSSCHDSSQRIKECQTETPVKTSSFSGLLAGSIEDARDSQESDQQSWRIFGRLRGILEPLI